MRGVSIPSHQFSATANSHLQNSSSVDPMLMEELTFSCRAFTRVVLRLRAQAEAEAMSTARSNGTPSYPTSLQPRSRTYSNSAVPHRTPSKWSSQTSINMSRASSRAPSPAPSSRYNASAARGPFQSPLFRLRRAPLLQVFVPSPEGDWLSDASILECEAELRRAGVLHLMRAGDVVWDVAVGDEANIGRLVWDGNYLIVSSLLTWFCVPLKTFIPGSGLHLLESWRCASLSSDIGVSTLVLPSRHSNHGHGQPHRPYRSFSLGRSDRREPTINPR